MSDLELSLRQIRDSGSKSLVAYIMAGVRSDWPDLIRAVIDGGADAVEVGLPFSDPMLDGPTIQLASRTALDRGAQFEQILDDLPDVSVPLVAMTYSNHLYSRGTTRFLNSLASAGISGSVIADLPFDESSSYRAAAESAGVDSILMVAPSTSADAARQICESAHGFVYYMGSMTPTGSFDGDGSDKWKLADDLRAEARPPVLIGFGIDSPAKALKAAQKSDGVVVGSAFMAPVLAGASANTLRNLVEDFRRDLDTMRDQ
ncbi:hypothetical protein XU06_30255 (plasmid) [Rhodococcus erythropolis]|uniref:tryptophan synthase subunit alpha n=1 Tax=Rhodococcus erythropolis TaxID=1833 RepID=UPI00061B6A1D|nr:tryptophan synthase subunit alpha [Rhodococcus erythropolis]AKE01214.1 hypothetical protein XU06_30255 [Rhodococcus erythropolis]